MGYEGKIFTVKDEDDESLDEKTERKELISKTMLYLHRIVGLLIFPIWYPRALFRGWRQVRKLDSFKTCDTGVAYFSLLVATALVWLQVFWMGKKPKKAQP